MPALSAVLLSSQGSQHKADKAPLVTLTSPAAERTGNIASQELTVSFAKPSA